MTLKECLCASFCLIGGLAGCQNTPELKELSINDVLSWKSNYSKYLDKNVEFLLKELGEPKRRDDEDKLQYVLGNPLREYTFIYTRNTIIGIMIYPTTSEFLHSNTFLMEPQLYSFEGGKFSDSTTKTFTARDVDGNTFQFMVKDDYLAFYRLIVPSKEMRRLQILAQRNR